MFPSNSLVLVALWVSVVLLCVLLSNNRPIDNNRSRLLAEDALRAACDSVHEVMRSLLDAYEDELRTIDPRSKRLWVSLDDRQQESSQRRDIALEPPSDSRLVERRRVTDMQQMDLCASLAGKRITMIGGEQIHRLHVHLLQHRERAEGKPFPCPYHEFCTHHHICLPHQHFQEDIPRQRYIKPPTTRELIETESAVVNYIVSDTLSSSSNESSRKYTLPYLDPLTGVRVREAYWLAAARKANVVILGRGPLSAPAQTYTGNWSFLHPLPDYVDKSRAAFVGKYASRRDAYQPVPLSLEILNAAVHLTVSGYLPNVVQLLRTTWQEIHPSKRKRLIWLGNWYRLPRRGIARAVLLRPNVRPTVQDVLQQGSFHHSRPRSSADHFLTSQLSALINADVTNTSSHEDPWTLLFNAQVYLQNMLLRELLPRYGIVFLPLDIHKHSDATTVEVDSEVQMTAIGEAFLTELNTVLRPL